MSLGNNPRIWFVLMLAAFLGTLSYVPVAQAENDPAGTWTAKVDTPMGVYDVTLVLTKSDNGWLGTLEGQQGKQDVLNLEIIGDLVEFELFNKQMNITAKFEGALNEEGNRLNGAIKVPSMPQAPTQDFNFIKQVDQVVGEDGGKKYRVGSGPAGVWVGRVRSTDGEESTVTLLLDKEGSDWLVRLEDPFVSQVRGQNVKVTDTLISFTFRPEGAPFPSHFTGTYIAAEDRVTGSFSQRGASRFVKFDRDPTTITLGLGPDGEPIQPPRVRHDYKLAATGRISYWPALHLVKDEYYNINNLTSSSMGFDLGLKYFVLDGFNVFVRGFRGGQGFTDDQAKLDQFAYMGLSSDAYLKLDGFEFGVMGYLGNKVTPNSAFNPYLTASAGWTSWEVTEDGRGSDVLDLDSNALTGSDFSAAFGLGTEYELNASMCLEFEFLWRYFMTEDETIWTNPDETWTNTHAWSLSAGFTYGFF